MFTFTVPAEVISGSWVYPTADSGEVVNIGVPASGGDEVNLQEQVPLISIRLAPSVDTNYGFSWTERNYQPNAYS